MFTNHLHNCDSVIFLPVWYADIISFTAKIYKWKSQQTARDEKKEIAIGTG